MTFTPANLVLVGDREALDSTVVIPDDDKPGRTSHLARRMYLRRPARGLECVDARPACASVCDEKTGLEDFARGPIGLGVEIVATAGTAASLRSVGLEVGLVSDLTRFPDAFLGGRVKTLQPTI